METDAILEGWKKLRLTSEEEEVAVDIDNDALSNTTDRMRFCLAGKLLCPRQIGSEIIRRTLSIAWRVVGRLQVERLGQNVFLFTFTNVADRNRVVRSGPWFFDKFLLVLVMMGPMDKPSDLVFDSVSFWLHFYDLPMACMNATMAKKLGDAVGTFEDVDCNEDGLCWGASLRVRVRIDITKPLRRGIKINVDGPIGGCWIPIKFEKLPDFCSGCGLLGHVYKDCPGMTPLANGSPIVSHDYGSWLRFEGPSKPPVHKEVENNVEKEVVDVGLGKMGAAEAGIKNPRPVTVTPQPGGVSEKVSAVETSVFPAVVGDSGDRGKSVLEGEVVPNVKGDVTVTNGKNQHVHVVGPTTGTVMQNSGSEFVGLSQMCEGGQRVKSGAVAKWKRTARLGPKSSTEVGALAPKRKSDVDAANSLVKKVKLADDDGVLCVDDGTDLAGVSAEAVEQPRREL